MRGISFKIKNEAGKILNQILEGIDINVWNWMISNEEVYTDRNQVLFRTNIIDGKSLLETIQNELYYVIFIKLAAFTNKIVAENIKDYNNFFDNKECYMVILITDSEYTEIYCKNSADIEQIKQNVMKMGCDNIEYITDENDERYTFDI